MCGICGSVNLSASRVPHRDVLEAMVAQLHHRGPDASGVVVDGDVALGHTRLAIVDLSGGRQPMVSSDGRFTLTFNGEIFNYIELRDELEKLGRRFRTTSDTEVLLQAYAQWKLDCVPRLNGQFAFALWDRVRRELVLVRDRLGIKPLFTTQAGGRLLFASKIKALFASPEVHRELDPHGLDQVFTFWSCLPPRTPFRGIAALPPGHFMTVRGGRVSPPRSYWQVEPHPVDEQCSQQDWAEQVREVLLESTRLRLRSDVPVGAYLSGGLDSSIATHLIKEVTGGSLKTFSVRFDDPNFDEGNYQRQVIDHLDTKHATVTCRASDITRLFPDVV